LTKLLFRKFQMRTEKLEFFGSMMLEAMVVPKQQQIETFLLQSQLYKVLNGLQFQLRRLIRYVALKISMPRGKKKGLSTKKFDRCVTKVKSRSGKKANPYAVCNASMGGKTKHRKSK
jgi:hypothetical protein